jgi:dGTPase
MALGETHSRRIDTMVRDMIEASLAAGGSEIRLSQAVSTAVSDLRDWLFEHVYRVNTVHDDFVKASRILRELFLCFSADEEMLVAQGGRRYAGDPLVVSAADFVAGMTDRFAMNLYHRLFLPQPWKLL